MNTNHTRRVSTTVKNSRKVQDRRGALIAAARKVFLQKGFHATTVREIGVAAGLTQGTIYNYIRSKDDILYLLCDQAWTDYEDAVRRALNGTSGTARVEAIVRAFIEAAYDHQDLIVLMHRESHFLDQRSLRGILARIDGFNRFVSGAMADAVGDRRPALATEALAINIVTFLPSIVALRRWDLKDKVTYDETVEGLTQFIVRGLGLETSCPAGRSQTRLASNGKKPRSRTISEEKAKKDAGKPGQSGSIRG